MKKIVIFVTKKSLFEHSGVGKYIGNYIPYLKEKYDLEVFYQPEHHGLLSGLFWRFFKLPQIIKKRYGGYIKIFFDENFLISVRPTYAKECIAIVHHYPFKTKVSNIKEHVVRRLSFLTFNTILRKISHIVTVSNQSKTVLQHIGIKEDYITVIPNSIDLSAYEMLGDTERKLKRKGIAGKYNIFDDKKRLLYVGSNESRKNMLTLFKALALLPEDYILVRVGKDGSSDELVKMQKIITESNLEKRYFHLQDLSEEDLIALYQVSDIYIMPSLYEGFGRPVIEAQACGLPVISTKCGALAEVCGDGALFVDDPLDYDAFCKSVLSVEVNKDMLGAKGQKNTYKYSTSFNILAWDSVINSF